MYTFIHVYIYKCIHFYMYVSVVKAMKWTKSSKVQRDPTNAPGLSHRGN